MRRSKTISLLLCSSLAIFGIGHVGGCDAQVSVDDDYDGWEPAPVYVDGVMGVYHPTTHIFIPHTSPQFVATTSLIKTTHINTIRSGGTSSMRGGFGAMGGKSGIAS